MLPWLKNKQIRQPGVTMAVRKSEGGFAEENPSESDSYGLNHAAKELIEAVAAKDETRVAAALKAAFEHLEKQPHEEAPHPES